MRKVIRLKEEDIRKAAKKILFERLGVPDNLYETALFMYNLLSREIQKIPNENHDLEFNFTFKEEFKIGDVDIDGFTIDIYVKLVSDENQPLRWIQGQFVPQDIQQGDQIYSSTKSVSPLQFNIKFVAPPSYTASMLKKYFIEHWNEITFIFSHELKHVFDGQKINSRYVGDFVNYHSAQRIQFEKIPAMNHFLHIYYFTTSIELSVRVSEMYGELRNANITKDQFIATLNKSQSIKQLKYARSLTYEKFIDELLFSIPAINNFLVKISKENPEFPFNPEASDLEKIENFLNIVFLIFKNQGAELFISSIRPNIHPVMAIFQPDEANRLHKEAEKYFNKYVESFDTYKNGKDFFVKEIKRINFASSKTLKTIHKLYDMLPDSENNIINWELHHKINRTAEKTKQKLQELLQDPKKKFVKKEEKKNDNKKSI